MSLSFDSELSLNPGELPRAPLFIKFPSANISSKTFEIDFDFNSSFEASEMTSICD